jgi:hypothetical protein
VCGLSAIPAMLLRGLGNHFPLPLLGRSWRDFFRGILSIEDFLPGEAGLRLPNSPAKASAAPRRACRMSKFPSSRMLPGQSYSLIRRMIRSGGGGVKVRNFRL